MNEQEIKEMLERIAALEKKNSSLENKVNILEKQVETVNKFVAATTESQSIETAMNEIESVTKQLTDCDKATFYCYDSSADKFFSHGDYRNWQDARSAEEIKTAFAVQKIHRKEKEAVIPLVTSKGKSLGVIVAEKECGFKKTDFDSFKQGSNMVNTVELALKKEYEHQGRITDELTNLKNRQGLNEYLKNTLCGNLNEEKPVSIVMCDIDHFKAVNDTYGHEAGDTILKGVAAVLGGGTRDGADCAFRMGGEEMVLILNCAPEKAVDITERLREQIENTVHTVMQNDTPAEVKVTVSMGVCDIRPNVNIEVTPDNIREVFDEELTRADRAAYSAKNNGRNQVVVYEPKIYKSYLEDKASELLCGGNTEAIPKIKESIVTCLESKNQDDFYSVTDTLQDYAANNPQSAETADGLISKICRAYGYDVSEQEKPLQQTEKSKIPVQPSAVYEQQDETKLEVKYYNKNEYSGIQNKTYIGTDAKTAYNISRFAEEKGVNFSAKFDGKNSAVTVDGVKNKGFIETVKSMSEWSNKVQIKAAKAREQYQKPSQNTDRGR